MGWFTLYRCLLGGEYSCKSELTWERLVRMPLFLKDEMLFSRFYCRRRRAVAGVGGWGGDGG